MTEAEGSAIRFTIDHYEPQSIRPELTNEYTNLMYACDECNIRKGDRCPPPDARRDGKRFFRPDEDVHSEHFSTSGVRLEASTTVAQFTILTLDLNRLSLRRLREIRRQVFECERFVSSGTRELSNFRIDQLPPQLRARALGAIKQAAEVADELAAELDVILTEASKSPLIDDGDPDPNETARLKKRAAELRNVEALYPGMRRSSSKPGKL